MQEKLHIPYKTVTIFSVGWTFCFLCQKLIIGIEHLAAAVKKKQNMGGKKSECQGL